MKTIVLAILAVLILGTVAATVLGQSQTLAYQAYVTSGARVSDPGHNLVGPGWTGDLKTKSDGPSS